MAVWSRVSTAVSSRRAHVLDLDRLEDLVDRLPLEDLDGQGVGQPFLLDPGPNSPDDSRRFASAIDSISCSRSSSSTLIPSASAIFARMKNSLRLRRVDLVGVGADLGLAGPDVAVREAFLLAAP